MVNVGKYTINPMGMGISNIAAETSQTPPYPSNSTHTPFAHTKGLLCTWVCICQKGGLEISGVESPKTPQKNLAQNSIGVFTIGFFDKYLANTHVSIAYRPECFNVCGDRFQRFSFSNTLENPAVCFPTSRKQKVFSGSVV